MCFIQQHTKRNDNLQRSSNVSTKLFPYVIRTADQTDIHPRTKDMLDKLLKLHKLARFSRHDNPKPPPVVADGRLPGEENTSALRIVHAGGQVDCYYMAVPATTILEKYPSHVLAKPEVFTRPWDSVLRPENILRPGQKFYLVPRHTVTKLRRRIGRPGKDKVAPLRNDDESIASGERSGCFSASFKSKVGLKKHVTFALVEVKHKAGANKSAATGASSSSRKSSSGSRRSHAGRRKPLKAITWEPSLTAINESQGG